MRNATLEKLIWVLIYGGMIAFALGLFMRLGSDTGGVPVDGLLMVVGVAAAALGAIGIWWRSRRPPDNGA